MRRSIVITYVASIFLFASASYAWAAGDKIFASGFQYRDFPGTPIVVLGAPANAATLFGAAGASSGGPCMADPALGTLFPNNWPAARFSWIAAGNENLFEVRLTSPSQDGALVLYTAAATWTMPADVWTGLSHDSVDQPITVTVRGATYSSGSGTLTSGPELGSSGTIRIAPVSAPGAIVYWTNPASGMQFSGFKIASQTPETIVTPASTECVGCHTSTPDGAYVGFSSRNGGGSTLRLASSDGQELSPSFITASAQTLMARQDQEAPAFSSLHWSAGNHIALTMYQSQIMWTDLEAASTAPNAGWGFVARNGDSGNALFASFAHTTDTVLYVSSTSPVSQGIISTTGAIKTVPFNNGAGGSSFAIVSTSDNAYYPSYSSDDKYIAYNRVPGGASSYNNAQAEVYVVPSVGGNSVRIAANDPSACTGMSSPGVTNSWPRWSPSAQDSGGRRFYWLTFSSTRGDGQRQVYIAPIVDNGTTLTTYPALYPPAQAAAEDNHTPAWGNFSIP